MKKVLKTLAVLVVLAAAGFFGYRYYQSRQAVAAQATAGSTYTEYTVSTGSLSKTVTGTGTLSISQTDDVALDYAVTVTDTLVEAGDVERAAEFLGHRHCLSRTVEHGQRLGRTIGIPTVNLTMPPHVLVPAYGVYITRVHLPDGRSFAGVTNVGTRPTVSDSNAVSVETFLLDFDGDLYGQTVRLDFCRRLRGERKFASLEDLRQQIQQNIAQTRAYFQTTP